MKPKPKTETLNDKLGRRLKHDNAHFRSPTNLFRLSLIAAIALVALAVVLLL